MAIPAIAELQVTLGLLVFRGKVDIPDNLGLQEQKELLATQELQEALDIPVSLDHLGIQAFPVLQELVD